MWPPVASPSLEARGENHGWKGEGAEGDSLWPEVDLCPSRVVGFRRLFWDGTGASVVEMKTSRI